MNRYKDLVQKVDSLIVSIPMEGSAIMHAAVGDRVKKDETLYSVNRKNIAESYYLPAILGVSVERLGDYIGRVGGEFVQRGDLLAEKIAAGGLIVKQVFAGQEGVVSRARLEKGFLDILSESESFEVKSQIDGVVKEIILNSSISIETSGARISYQYSKGLDQTPLLLNGEVIGDLKCIGSRDSMPAIGDLESNYGGRVVYVGRTILPELALELYKRDASAIITYSMLYSDIHKLNLPIVVLGGFGNLPISQEIDSYMHSIDGYRVLISSSDRFISIAKGYDNENSNNYFGRVGDTKSVQIIEPDRLGGIGTISGNSPHKFDDQGVVFVNDAAGRTLLVDREGLKLVRS